MTEQGEEGVAGVRVKVACRFIGQHQIGLLHQGARGYVSTGAAQRRLREAYFVAIVTPATKHLRKEIARIEAGATACALEM